MAEGSGFTSMAAAATEGDAPEVGVGMLGYAFMGKAHSNAMLKIPHMMYPPPGDPEDWWVLLGAMPKAVKEAAKRFGYANYYTDWRDMLENDAFSSLTMAAPTMPMPNRRS